MIAKFDPVTHHHHDQPEVFVVAARRQTVVAVRRDAALAPVVFTFEFANHG
jgi:hypothetical protein